MCAINFHEQILHLYFKLCVEMPDRRAAHFITAIRQSRTIVSARTSCIIQFIKAPPRQAALNNLQNKIGRLLKPNTSVKS